MNGNRRASHKTSYSLFRNSAYGKNHISNQFRKDGFQPFYGINCAGTDYVGESINSDSYLIPYTKINSRYFIVFKIKNETTEMLAPS